VTGVPSRTENVVGEFDLGLTLRFLVPKSPFVARMGPGAAILAARTPAGPAVLEIHVGAGTVTGNATGPGAAAILDDLPVLLRLDDDPERFDPPPGPIARLHRSHRGLRLGRTGRMFEALLPVILGQRVTREEAKSAYRLLCAALGEELPDRSDLRLPPAPERIAGLAYSDLHRFGVEQARAQVVIEAARRAGRLEEALLMDATAARRRLRAVPGIGPWSTEQVMGSAWGDRDAVPTGDYHLPHTVGWMLAGEDRGDDARMLELLEPYRPHRRRAVLLIKLAGVHAPRYGPRGPRSSIGLDG
jgi:3-methyladenine DNA glycosylase/8-oxoguanine DNA glycosylase